MTDAFINRIATALPPHDVHEGFIDFARRMLKGDSRRVALFNRMAERLGFRTGIRFSIRRALHLMSTGPAHFPAPARA